MSYLRALPALLVLVLFPLVLLGIVVAIITGGIWMAIHLHSRWGIMLATLVLVGLIGTLIATFRALRSAAAEGEDAAPAALSRAEAPALWSEVDALASAVGTRTVDRILLVPAVNAAVSQRRGRRDLNLGLPLVAMARRDELRAVLAHELGHYAGGQWALSSFLLRTQHLMVTMRDEASGIWAAIIGAYTWVYVGAARASSREIEHACDGFSVRLAGSAATASALRTVVSAVGVWSRLTDHLVGPYFEATGKRASLVDGIHRVAADDPEGLERAVTARIAGERGSWGDSHPLIRDRIARVAASSVPGPAGGSEPALAMLPRDLLPLEARMLMRGDLPVLSWDDLLAEGAPTVAGRLADANLLGLAQNGAIVEPTVRAALDQHERAPIGTGMTPPAGMDAREADIGLLTLLASDALARCGAGRWGADLHDVHLLGHDGAPWDLRPVVGDAGPGAATRLRELLVAHGADLDRRPDGTAADHAPAPDEPLAALVSTMIYTVALRDLIVLPEGLLVLRSGLSPFALFAGDAREDRQIARVQRHLAEGLDAARSRPGSVWLTAEQIRTVNLGNAAKGPVVRITPRTGRTIVLRPGPYTLVFGELGGALLHVLPGRLTMGLRRTPAEHVLAKREASAARRETDRA